jgi:hypothetical protein
MHESLINYVNFLLENQSRSEAVNNSNQRKKTQKSILSLPNFLDLLCLLEKLTEAVDMNGRIQMQEGKNWILLK